MKIITNIFGCIRVFTVLLLLTTLAFRVNNASAAASAADIFSDTSFFPVAVWLQSPSNASAYKNAGINLFVGLWEGPTKEQLDQLKSAGMPVLCDQNEFALENIDAYKDIIAGWMHMDEPDNAQSDGSGGYGPCIDPDTIIQKYSAWKANDPQRPVYLNLGQGVAYIDYIGRGSACHARTDLYPRYIRGCDIASYDIYPVNSQYASVKGNLWYVAKGIDSLRMWSSDQKEAWCWIECTRIDTSSSAAPSSEQVKAEVWMALIHGAKGFGYFCHSWYGGFKEAGWLGNSEMKTAITAINNRISALAPVLNSSSVSGKVTIESEVPSVPVDIMVKNHYGSIYIFAAAMRGNAVTGSFSIADLSGTEQIEVLDENRSITVNDGKFQDRFDEYGVHLYKVTANSGIRDKFSGRMYARRRSPLLIPVMPGGAGFVSANVQNGESVMIYTLQGKFINSLSKMNAGSLKVPDGAYVLQTR